MFTRILFPGVSSSCGGRITCSPAKTPLATETKPSLLTVPNTTSRLSTRSPSAPTTHATKGGRTFLSPELPKFPLGCPRHPTPAPIPSPPYPR